MRSLRRTLVYQIIAFIVCLLVISLAAVWGIQGLSQDLTLATRSFERLKDVYEIGSHVATAQALVRLETPQYDRAERELGAAATEIEAERDESPAEGGGPTLELTTAYAHIRQAQKAVGDVAARRTDHLDNAVFARSLGAISENASTIRTSIVQLQKSAYAKKQRTIIAISTMAALLLIASITVGWFQYRGVIRPLTQLGNRVRTMAAGDLSRRVDLSGAKEFTMLADDFNHMASQLDELYQHLEQQVREKSQELARSQRLASVGFLAAGVAHEINNPLGIITGFAEFTLEHLKQNPQPGDEATAKALQAICDEAFRCKAITEKLLSMARSTESPRLPVDLADVVREVIDLLQPLKQYQGRQIHFSHDGDTIILASEPEMKQVVLNLLTNALEAVQGDRGEVWVVVRRNGKQVEMSVKDNGAGMTPQTLESVFEPFFTLPREGRRGTGLGLSITHAIVDGHQGSIKASSAGLGQGSEFVTTFPAA